jgi:hypothetical protein
MSRKRLLSEEMLSLSAAWIQPQSPAHQAILANQDLAALLPRITAAHNAVSATAQPSTDNPRLDEISQEQADIDTRHDDLIRGAHAIFSGIAALLGPHDGADFLELRNQLIPDGLASTQKTYRAESGQADQLATRLTPEIRAITNKIRLDPKNTAHTLTHYLDEWIALGKQLGTLEDEKTRLEPADITPAKHVAARNNWIRIVNLFHALAETAELDPSTYKLIFGPLLDAETKAAHRGRAPAPTPHIQPEAAPETTST